MKGFIATLAFLIISLLGQSQSASLEEVRNWSRISDVMEHQDIAYFEELKILGFELLYKPYSNKAQLFAEINNEDDFNENILNLLHKAESGSRIWFDNIQVINTDGEKGTISISIKVE